MSKRHELSIRKKIMRSVPLSCGLIVALACTLFAAYDVAGFRNSISADLAGQAQILAAQAAKAVSSGDDARAREALDSLAADSNIGEARIYSRDGALLASYERTHSTSVDAANERRSAAKSWLATPIVAKHLIRMGGANVGTVYLASEPAEMAAYIEHSGTIALLITMISFLLSYGLAIRLQRTISKPILELAKIAFAVSLHKDYSIRATKQTSDATGYLFDRFNEMLGQIQERELALQAAHHELENRVNERTHELQAQVIERKETERALAEQTSFLNSLIENAPLGILVLDAERRIKMCNPAFEKLYGHRQQEILAKSIYDVVPSADSSAEVDFIDSKIKEGGTAHLVAQRRRSDGSRLDVEVYIARIIWDGQTVGFLGISRDITERKRADRELADRKEFLNSLIENIPVGMLAIDAGSHVRMCNPAFERIFGYRREDILGQVAVDLLATPETRTEVIANRERLLKGETVRLLTRRKRRDGTAVDVEAHSVPLYSGGEYSGALLLYEDIADRKQAEVALLRAKEAAEAANRAKSEFLANMSHEIRTPMNGIVGMTELALDTNLTSEQREYLVTVQSSADSLLTVINDILDFSKIEAGKLDLEAIEFNLSDFLGDTMRTLGLRAEQKGLQLAFEIEPNVPDALVGDPARLRQVVVNLVGNAIKFTEHGEVVLDVQIESLAQRDVLLHFIVSDTGIGISPEKQSAIFEAFSQADGSMTRKYGGTGLGLTISSRLVELMDGHIWVESEPGNGSRFHFTARFESRETAAGPAIPGDPASLRDMPVLVVDDNATNRQILVKLLDNWNMKPTAVESGRRAIEVLTENKKLGKKFPLILLDAQMPEMDGFSLAEHVKRNLDLRAATVIMLSSAGQRGETARCRELGIGAYLTRPVRQAALLEAILNALGTGAIKTAGSPAPNHGLSDTHRRLQVLVAEDNAANRLVAQRLLEKHGHSVTVAENGNKTLKALEQRSFDLVLMDIQMPEMNGLEATQAIRNKELVTGEHVPIVAMTAHAIKGDAERCIAAGMDGYLAKPISSAELLKLLNRISAARHDDLTVPPVPEPPATSVIDVASTLGRLDGDRDLLAELVRVFQTEYAGIVSELRDAVQRQDARQIEQRAHTLKGASAQLGAVAVSRAAVELEQMARLGQLDGAAERFHCLESEIERLSSALETLCPT